VLDKIARILKQKGTLFVSDFQYTTWWSKQLIKLMYVFFGMSTRIAARQLAPLNTLILAKEFETSAHLFRKDGMIFSKGYTKINTD
jgi:ubiquinone/menaquinone biosynthesis C-methylase UbiE